MKGLIAFIFPTTPPTNTSNKPLLPHRARSELNESNQKYPDAGKRETHKTHTPLLPAFPECSKGVRDRVILPRRRRMT